ncbi:MAG: uroporphyrinogen-III C-methyltransferase, partial [Wenyingzhuangia sp.]
VVLMGMSKLEKIVNAFLAHGKTEIPVAIIENGTWDKEQLAIGKINTILEIINQKGLKNPSMIVIGETVKESKVLYEYLLNKKGLKL